MIRPSQAARNGWLARGVFVFTGQQRAFRAPLGPGENRRMCRDCVDGWVSDHLELPSCPACDRHPMRAARLWWACSCGAVLLPRERDPVWPWEVSE